MGASLVLAIPTKTILSHHEKKVNFTFQHIHEWKLIPHIVPLYQKFNSFVRNDDGVSSLSFDNDVRTIWYLH